MEISRDRVLLVAAGTTFYLLLALFPAISAFVSLYGLFADPAAIADNVSLLRSVLPASGLEIIRQRLEVLVNQDQQTLGLRFAISLLVAFWSAGSGVKALFEAMNVAFGEREERGFIRFNLIALGFTLGAMVAAALLASLVAIVPLALRFLSLDEQSQIIIAVLRWPILLVLIVTGITLLYRYGPSCERARWRWISAGGVFATVVWLAVSAGFSVYVARFADYEATYGSLGTLIGFMVWTWLSVATVIIGAEIDAEIDRDNGQASLKGGLSKGRRAQRAAFDEKG